MSKGLEALQRNKYEIESADDFLLIEKELKALEIIRNKISFDEEEKEILREVGL